MRELGIHALTLLEAEAQEYQSKFRMEKGTLDAFSQGG